MYNVQLLEQMTVFESQSVVLSLQLCGSVESVPRLLGHLQETEKRGKKGYAPCRAAALSPHRTQGRWSPTAHCGGHHNYKETSQSGLSQAQIVIRKEV
jgi:hypothetical protein